MNVHNTLTWALFYLSIVYSNNVVYSTETGTSLTAQPSTDPGSTTPDNGQAVTTPISGSTAFSADGSATSTDQSSSKSHVNNSPVDNKGLKLFSIDTNNNKVDLDKSLYEHKLLFKDKNVLVFNFKDTANCVSVAVENKVIWSLEKDETPLLASGEKEYPVKVFYTLPSPEFEQSHSHLRTYTSSKLVFVVFNDKFLHYMLVNDKWVLKMNEDIPAKEYEAFLKEADAQAKAQPVKVAEPVKTTDPSGQPAEGSKVKSQQAKAAEGQGQQADPNAQSASTHSDASGTPSNQESSEYTLNVDTTSHDNTKYDLKSVNNEKTFTFKPNVKCSEVKCGNISVWKTGDQNLAEPKSVVYNKNDNQITVRDDTSSVVYNKKTDGTWYHFTTVKIESDVTSSSDDKASKQPESSGQPGDGSTAKTSDDTQPETGSSLSSGTEQLLLNGLYPDGAASSHVLDVTEAGEGTKEGTGSTDGSGSQQAEGSTTGTDQAPDASSTPSTDPDASEDGTETSAEPGEASATTPESTEQSSDSGSTVPVAEGATPPTTPASQQPSGQDGTKTSGEGSGITPGTDQSSSEAPTTTTTDTSKSVKLTGVELSLKAKEGTNQFDYKKDGKTVTYTAKQGYGFSAVKTKSTSGGCSSCCGSTCCGGTSSNVTIWETKDATEYATKVVLNGKGQKTKTVTIHLPNDKKKSYYRPEKSKPWVEGTGTPTPKADSSSNKTESKSSTTESKSAGADSTNECHLKIYTKDPNDSSKTIEVDHTKIKPVGDKGDNKLYKYEFGEQVKPTEVKYSDESVWKHGDHNTQEHPKFIFYHELVKIVFVEVPKDTFHFYRKKIADKKWEHEQLKSTDKVDKNKVKLYTDSSGKNELSSDKYSVKEFPFGVEYAIKDGSNCQHLKYESKKFTFSKDPSGKYPLNICLLNNKHCVVVYTSRASYKTPDS